MSVIIPRRMSEGIKQCVTVGNDTMVSLYEMEEFVDP